MTNATAVLTDKIAAMTTDQIREAVHTISASPLDASARFVRAHLIEEFIRRDGLAAGDALMDEIGL